MAKGGEPRHNGKKPSGKQLVSGKKLSGKQLMLNKAGLVVKTRGSWVGAIKWGVIQQHVTQRRLFAALQGAKGVGTERRAGEAAPWAVLGAASRGGSVLGSAGSWVCSYCLGPAAARGSRQRRATKGGVSRALGASESIRVAGGRAGQMCGTRGPSCQAKGGAAGKQEAARLVAALPPASHTRSRGSQVRRSWACRGDSWAFSPRVARQGAAPWRRARGQPCQGKTSCLDSTAAPSGNRLRAGKRRRCGELESGTKAAWWVGAHAALKPPAARWQAAPRRSSWRLRG